MRSYGFKAKDSELDAVFTSFDCIDKNGTVSFHELMQVVPCNIYTHRARRTPLSHAPYNPLLLSFSSLPPLLLLSSSSLSYSLQ